MYLIKNLIIKFHSSLMGYWIQHKFIAEKKIEIMFG